MIRRLASLFLAASLPLGAFAARAAGSAAPPDSGEARVDGKPLVVAHAYLSHAPDSWEEKEINAVVLLAPQPVDEKALRAADFRVGDPHRGGGRPRGRTERVARVVSRLCGSAWPGKSCLSLSSSLPFLGR